MKTLSVIGLFDIGFIVMRVLSSEIEINFDESDKGRSFVEIF